jgi:UDP-glucuronate 4-epimerase
MVLVTGAAGFIGYHVSEKLLGLGYEVTGIDNINNYYSPKLKWARIQRLKAFPSFKFCQVDLCDAEGLKDIFKKYDFKIVIHLAAQVGVRYSLENPIIFQQTNIEGFLNILELCCHSKIQNLIYASSSSVYGQNKKLPFSENDPLEGQISIYGVTKRTNELMAHCYSCLYGINTTGLRFFTAYGPWGRPDMAIFKFTDAILKGSPLNVFNNGKMKRDFTYIDDIVEGVIACLKHPFQYEIINLGNNSCIELLYIIEYLEHALGKKAEKILLPIQPGDCPITYADISKAGKLLDFKPKTNIEEGLKRFIEWYLSYLRSGS